MGTSRNGEGTFWGVIQSEPELESIGISGLQLLQVLPQDYVLFGLKGGSRGSLGGSAVWRLPLAQGVILESQDQVPHRAPGMEPTSPSPCVSAPLSLSVYHE